MDKTKDIIYSDGVGARNLDALILSNEIYSKFIEENKASLDRYFSIKPVIKEEGACRLIKYFISNLSCLRNDEFHKYSSRTGVYLYGDFFPVRIKIPLVYLNSKIQPSKFLELPNDHHDDTAMRLLSDYSESSFFNYFMTACVSDNKVETITSYLGRDSYCARMIYSSQQHLECSAMNIADNKSTSKSIIESLLSIEMSTKAFIYHHGSKTEDNLTDIGHKINKLTNLASLEDNGFPFNKENLKGKFKINLNSYISHRYNLCFAEILDQWRFHECAQIIFNYVVEVISKSITDGLDNKILIE